MPAGVVYFIVVIGLGFICVVIGFISGPNHFKKPVLVTTVPSGNMGDEYTGFNYRNEEQNFLHELKKRLMEKKGNWSDDYRQEKERRDGVAFSEDCNAGLFKSINAGDSGQ
jgi:hypothetical protein